MQGGGAGLLDRAVPSHAGPEPSAAETTWATRGIARRPARRTGAAYPRCPCGLNTRFTTARTRIRQQVDVYNAFTARVADHVNMLVTNDRRVVQTHTFMAIAVVLALTETEV